MGIGLVLGLVAERALAPYAACTPSATDRGETYAIATGPVDNEVEAVYFLDFLTGDLGAVVLGPSSRAPGPASFGPTSRPIWASIRRRTRSS